MIGGSIVLGHGGLANPLVVADQGFPVKIIAQVADWARSTGIVVQKELANASPADLKGKTLVAPDIPVLRMFWLNWAAANKIEPTSVKWLNAAPSDALAAFLSNRADLMLMWAPAMNRAIDAGGVLWQDGHNSYRPGASGPSTVYYNWGVVFVSADWYAKHPKTAEAYLSGLYLAQAYLKCHREEVAQLVGAEARLDPKLGMQLMKQNDYALDMGPQFIADAQKATDFYTSSKMLKKPYKISDVIDRSLIEKVSKSVKVPPEWNKCS
jgi:NitT/TauT family transport system substrate-binding protein